MKLPCSGLLLSIEVCYLRMWKKDKSYLFIKNKHAQCRRVYIAVIESRSLVSRRVLRPVFSSLGLKGFQSRAASLETLHELFFMKSCKKQLIKNGFIKQLLFKIQPFKTVSGSAFFVVMLLWRK